MLSLWLVGVVALVIIVLRGIWPFLRSSGTSSTRGIQILTGTKNTDYKALIEEQYSGVNYKYPSLEKGIPLPD